jgi:hypothetical protein
MLGSSFFFPLLPSHEVSFVLPQAQLWGAASPNTQK